MASWAARYKAGEWFAVWDELRRHVPEKSAEDAAEVARETMRRVAVNADTVVERLAAAGYSFAFPAWVRQAPTPDDLAAVQKAERVIGPLPLALRACLEVVGGVNLCGDGGDVLPHVGYHRVPKQEADFYPDPLVLPPGRHLWADWETWGDADQEGHTFSFAPDEIHKANVSGGVQDVELPSRAADPELLGARPGVTLVDYLRISFAWGGFPGHDALAVAPRAVEDLRRDLLMF
ncbi:hypothetical protein FDA94_03310 [Herbidospora galbida]|uniref:Uncharacterized protein n=1 Tax=Herbidospora galbida TaxID=2575442 RepID=A0A4U3MR45_9ACTN|nr:hypothetical protein [Herbidospora galbida]TKK90807.1 hypothetical protein FDA94_03310 [Herbidospora galbida]